MSCRGEAYVVEIASCSTTCDNSIAREILPLFAAVEALRGKDGAGMETIEIVDNKIRVTMTDGRILETDTISAGLADKELSSTSGNPVQNRVLYAKFAEERQRSEDAYDKKNSAKNALTDAKKYTDDREALILSVVGNKVDKVSNKGLSTNDYTTTDRNKLAGIEANAQKNVQPDWDETDPSKSSYIKNKPTISGGGAVDITIDTALSQTSTNPVQNKVVTEALNKKGEVKKVIVNGVESTPNANGVVDLGTISGGGSNITVDDSLSPTSINPVQNKVIYTALGEKQNVINSLDDIRSGAALGTTAVQPTDLASVATTGSYNDLLNTPTIPPEVTKDTVSDWGFTKYAGVPVVEVNSQLSGFSYTLQPNTYYRLNGGANGTIFQLAAATDNTIVNEYVVEFSSVANVTDIYFPTSIVWANGEAPTFENPTVISIINGLGVWAEFTA